MVRPPYLTILTAVFLGACAQVLGTDGYGTRREVEDAGAESGFVLAASGWKYASRGCGECVARDCQTEVAACHADPTCDAFGACVAACGPGDAACGTNCERGVQGTFFSPRTFDLIECGLAHCVDACGAVDEQTRCGAIPAPTPRETVCCEPEQKCLADPECRGLFACWSSCQATFPSLRSKCLQGCAGPNAAGNQLQKDFWDCLATKCNDTQCMGVGDDGCLESVVVPRAGSEERRVYLHVSDGATRRPMPGILVEEFARVDWDFSDPIDSRTTDGDGDVDLKVGSDLSGQPNVFFRATGAGIQTQQFYPALFWLNFPTAISFSLVSDAGLAAPSGDHATVGFAVHGCSFQNEAGFQVTVSPSDATTTRYYFSTGSLSAEATLTDATGFGAFAGVPVGKPVHLTAVRAGTGKELGSVDAFPVAGTTTTVVITPTPTE